MLYSFLEFELDQAALELRKNGVPIEVQPKVLDLIVFLIENRDKVSSKEELFKALWKDVVVSETALTRLVKEARKVLDDDGDAQRMLSTTRGRGYRFAAPVTVKAREVRESLPISAPASAVSDELPPASRASTLVGREHEMAEIERALARARSGTGTVCLIHGERGIGKSRLLDEVALVARGSAMLVVRSRGAGTPGTVQPPYRLWIDLLRAARRLAPEGDPTHRHVATALSAFETLATGETSTRYRAIDAAIALFHGVRDRAVVVAIDDLHAADAASLDVLSACVAQLRDARVAFVLAYADAALRTDQAFATTIAGLSTEAAARTMELHGLSEAAVAVLTDRLGGKAERADVLHRKTGGNPLLLMQFLKAAKPIDDRSYGSLDVSDAIALALAHVLAALSAEARDLLRVAAVFGTRFSVGALAQAAELSGEATLERLDEALRARLIEKIPSSISDYGFSRPILRDVAYGQLDEAQRARFHTRVGEALLATTSDASMDSALHLLRGAPAGDATRALEVARAAGDRAIARGEIAAALALVDRAMEVIPLAASAEPHKGALTALRDRAIRIRDGGPAPEPAPEPRPIRAATATTINLDDGYSAGRELAETIKQRLSLGKASAGLVFSSVRALRTGRLELAKRGS